MSEETATAAFQKGIVWMEEHPQRLKAHLALYANELMFYYLMVEKSETEKEKVVFKGIFLQRLKQSDGFPFKAPASVYDTSHYTAILGYRKWFGDWATRNPETDSTLLNYVNNDLRKNNDLYLQQYPHELKYIKYISRKFNIDLEFKYDPEFKWWVFFGIDDYEPPDSKSSDKLNYFDVLVAFHVTHAILIDSDYSLRYLDKKNCPREYQYILANMQKFMHNRHFDLVAEFVICLQTLNETKNEWYQKAVGFLLENQNENGSWPPNIFSYNNKHTTIVALWALKDHNGH